MGVNAGTQLINNTKNPGILDEYEKGFKVMHSLACDVPLGSHPAMYNLAEKYAKLSKGGPNPFIDPQGYQKEVAVEEAAFRQVLAEQKK